MAVLHRSKMFPKSYFFSSQFGQIEITNHTTGDYSLIHFKPGGWFGKELNKVEGSIFSAE